MPALAVHESQLSLAEVENWAALGAGGLLLLLGASRRSLAGLGMAAAATPLIYRGVTGRWPKAIAACVPSDDSKSALAGDRGLHVRESVRLELPVAYVYRFWRRLENLPSFMAHLDRVTVDDATGRSHWVAKGPAGLSVEWDAEVINEVENQTLGWRSLPGSDVVTAGSVNFDSVRGGRGTQVTVKLQYAPPAGKAGAVVAALFGRAPYQTIREDLRRLKQLLEAGELAQAQPRASRS
jgi:uncharacterized membrane protein